MWRNPKYHPDDEAPTAPPEETGERLLTIERPRDATELRLTREEYEGKPYLSLRVWRRGQDGAMWPTRKGVSIRMSEAPQLLEALAAAAPHRHHQPPPAASRPARADPPFQPARQPPPLPSANAPPLWLLEAAAGFDGVPVALSGTLKQIDWAGSIRSNRLASARRRSPELVPLLSIISDSTWWIANKDAPLTDVKWPSQEQVRRAPAPAPAEPFNELN
jgi:hypothetical protein